MNAVPEQKTSFPLRIVHLAKGKMPPNVFEQFALKNTGNTDLQRFLFLQMERAGQFTHKTFMLSLEELERRAFPGSRLWVQLQKKRKRGMRGIFDQMFLMAWGQLYKAQHVLYKQAQYAENLVDQMLEKVNSEDLQDIKKEVIAVKDEIADNIEAMGAEQTPPSEPTRETYQRINEQTGIYNTILRRLYARIMTQPDPDVDEPEVEAEELEPEADVSHQPYEYQPGEFDYEVYRNAYRRAQLNFATNVSNVSNGFAGIRARFLDADTTASVNENATAPIEDVDEAEKPQPKAA